MNLKDKILAANDIKREKVYIKEWDCEVYVQQMSAYEQDRFEQDSRGIDGKSNLVHIRAKMCAACLVDEHGNKIFDRPEDIIRLSAKSGQVLNRLIDKITSLNSISEEELETLAKN